MEYKLKEVVAEITQQCNMNCMHCGSKCDNNKPEKELSVKEWNNFASQLYDMGVEKIVYSGGEPTVKKGIEEIIRFTFKKGLKYGLITNGLNFPKSLLETVKTYRPFAIGISIDGLGKTHNMIRRNSKSWQKIQELLSELQRNKIQVCVVTTVNRLNYEELPRLAKWISLAEIDSWQLQIVMPSGRAKEQKDFLIDKEIFRKVSMDIIGFRQYYKEVNIQAADCFGLSPEETIRSKFWDGCSAGIASMGIDSTGNVMPCLSMRSELRCGNIRNQSVHDIWNFSEGFDFNRKFSPEKINGECSGCEYLTNCKGGCASISTAYFNHYYEAPFCYVRDV